MQDWTHALQARKTISTASFRRRWRRRRGMARLTGLARVLLASCSRLARFLLASCSLLLVVAPPPSCVIELLHLGMTQLRSQMPKLICAEASCEGAAVAPCVCYELTSTKASH